MQLALDAHPRAATRLDVQIRGPEGDRLGQGGFAEIQRGAAALDKEQPVVIYCRAGNRSGPAAEAFAASGWDAHSIEGGLLAWAEAGFELEPDGGSVTQNPNMPPR